MADIGVSSDISMGDLLKKMKALPERVQKNIVVGAVRASAKPIIKEAKQLVPKDTRTLEKSIGISKRKTKNKNIVHFSISPKRGGKYDGWYAHFDEFGTAKMVAHPFMRPAFEKKGEESIKAVEQYMSKRIDKEIEKL